MVQTIGSGLGERRLAVGLLALGLLAGSAGQALALPSFRTSPTYDVGRTVETLRGPAAITGSVGSMQTTTLPGRAGQGFLMDNGNGTSTLLVPGGAPQVVATPR
jgi:hypothetical protein